MCLTSTISGDKMKSSRRIKSRKIRNRWLSTSFPTARWSARWVEAKQFLQKFLKIKRTPFHRNIAVWIICKKNYCKETEFADRHIYKLFINSGSIFDNWSSRTSITQSRSIEIPIRIHRMRGKEYTIFYISLETKVPQDGATRPTAVNYPIARKYLYFLLGLKTGRGVKLIRINRLPFFFTRTTTHKCATPLRVDGRGRKSV